MKFSISSDTMRECSPKEIIETAVKCGFDGIDWVTAHGIPPKELARMCRSAGLAPVAYTEIATKFIEGAPHQEALDQIKGFIDDSIALDAQVMTLPPNVLNDSEGISARFSLWFDFLAEIAPIISSAGIVPSIKSTGRSRASVITSDEVLTILRGVPSLRLTFDCGNVATAQNPVEYLQRTMDYIVHSHFKDWYISNEEHDKYQVKRNGKYYSPAPVGSGMVPLAECFNLLRNAAYRGYINIESRIPGESHEVSLRRALEYMKQL